MPVIMPYATGAFNDTQFTVVLLLDKQPKTELPPHAGTSAPIREFNAIEVREKGVILRQNPDEQVEIPFQTPGNVILLKTQDGLSFTFSYRASEIKTIQFTQ
jgi:hypothetical protein